MSSDKISRPDGRLSLSNSVPPRAGQEKTSNDCGMPGGMFKLRFDWYISVNCLHKIQDSFPCTYMRVHVSTSYFKCSNMYLFTINSFLLWVVVKFHHFFWCWKHIQQFREAAIHSSMELVYFLEFSQIHVCLLVFCFFILRVLINCCCFSIHFIF